MPFLTLAAVSAALVAAVMIALWLISLGLRDSSIVDIAWGPIFVLLAAVGAAMGGGWAGRQLLVLGMVSLWGLRLGWHIHRRNQGPGEDPRYARWRRENGRRWWWVSLFKVFLLQGAVLWVVATPLLLALASPGAQRFTVWDALGELAWSVGFLYEAIADAQLAAFKAKPGRTGVLDTGLWRTSRHPNYFGEAVLWWGMALPALSVPGGWLALVSPLLMTVLLRYVSGVPMTEELMAGRDGWDEYAARTPIFVPGPVRDADR